MRLSADRERVLDKIKLLEQNRTFDIDVEDDPLGRTLLPYEVDYLRKKLSSRVKTKIAFFVARRFLRKSLKRKALIVKEIVGIENLDNLNSGAIITCNHFNAMDSFAIQMAYELSKHNKKRKFYRVIKEGNFTSFPGKFGFFMRNCYTLPLSSNKSTMVSFLNSMDKILEKGDFVLIYPEQSMWWNYRKPKPLKKTGFKLAYKSNVPILPCFITMNDSDIVASDGSYIQEYTIHILNPIYPNQSLESSSEIKRMADENYDVWKKTYEEEYGIPLIY